MDVERSWPPAADTGAAVFRPAPDTARFLLGQWNLVREVRDHRSGKTGTFRGKARLAPEQGDRSAIALRYSEIGELTFGGHHGPARRSLSYRERPDGGADVRFADGRPFYQLNLRAGYWQAEHLCGADTYVVSVRVVSDDCFTEQWRVFGPDKDYEMTTTYVRTGSRE